MPVAQTKNTPVVVHGTLVCYRRCKDGAELEKEFIGENHGEAAAQFTARHVRGLNDAEYKALPAEDRRKYEKRAVGGHGSNAATLLWMRIKPLWNWHTMLPFSVER